LGLLNSDKETSRRAGYFTSLPVLAMTYLLGRDLSQRPPRASEMTTKAIAAQVKAVLSADKPMTKNTIPRIRKAPDAFRLFSFMKIYPFN
jgi:hypothetical protein